MAGGEKKRRGLASSEQTTQRCFGGLRAEQELDLPVRPLFPELPGNRDDQILAGPLRGRVILVFDTEERDPPRPHRSFLLCAEDALSIALVLFEAVEPEAAYSVMHVQVILKLEG